MDQSSERVLSKWIKTNLPCPCGQSSDAYALDKNGNGKCFSGKCGERYFPNNKKEEEISEDSIIEFDYQEWRGIGLRTLERYDVLTRFVNEEPIDVWFKYPNKVAQTREYNSHKFKIIGDISSAPIWGMDKFDPGGTDSVILTEGHTDALTVYQSLGGSQTVLAVRSSSTAYMECSKETNRDYINSFSKIYICFDNDTPGQEAAKKIAPLFDFRKVYFVNLNRFKDPTEYLDNKEVDALVKAIKGAKRYAPDNVINSFSDIAQMLNEKQDEKLGTYPVKTLQDALKGLHAGEFVLFKGDSGLGKSEIFRMIEYHLLKTTEHPIGVMHFEESNNTTIRGIATYEMQAPAAMAEEDSGISNEEVFQAYKNAVNNNENRLFIRRSYDMDDINTIVDSIRYMVAGQGCRVVFFDHISWLAATTDSDDERRKLDALSQRLKLLCEELRFCLVMISHTNDDGKTRGSRYIFKVANTVIHLDRDKTNPDVAERVKLYLTVEKGRGQGTKTGPAGFVYYDQSTYTLKDLDSE